MSADRYFCTAKKRSARTDPRGPPRTPQSNHAKVAMLVSLVSRAKMSRKDVFGFGHWNFIMCVWANQNVFRDITSNRLDWSQSFRLVAKTMLLLLGMNNLSLTGTLREVVRFSG